MQDREYIATFNSTHHALTFERAAKNCNLKIIIMPVPRSIKASCGLAIKFSEDALDDIKSLINEKNLNYSGLYKIEDSNGKKDYIKMLQI
ncbi:DUF3343 domain-containing protein [Lutispora thermophila]|mgnify:CR=1 FL=1|uniref:Putative Se/S carrier protein-like domain-containing protein n=1 Tax=Lutispora thermophila DSM 19022 TaxID=1122184 RepID=A0A1M6GPW5_9FIRM|nr:DUF3343 domain-containing protein [Lutispora thermophila]SHJ12027.1 Protein of unknown function [Lutispora thermophila DSM 19022]